jgi:hypothetical protein
MAKQTKGKVEWEFDVFLRRTTSSIPITGYSDIINKAVVVAEVPIVVNEAFEYIATVLGSNIEASKTSTLRLFSGSELLTSEYGDSFRARVLEKLTPFYTGRLDVAYDTYIHVPYLMSRMSHLYPPGYQNPGYQNRYGSPLG